jgi:hypothetical protein
MKTSANTTAAEWRAPMTGKAMSLGGHCPSYVFGTIASRISPGNGIVRATKGNLDESTVSR